MRSGEYCVRTDEQRLLMKLYGNENKEIVLEIKNGKRYEYLLLDRLIEMGNELKKQLGYVTK